MALPSVYVYTLTPEESKKSLYERLPAGSTLWQCQQELEFSRSLARSAHVVAHPKHAQLFYLPAMLVLGFMKLRSTPGALTAWSKQLEEAMRHTGPYWDTRRAQHVIWSLRCASPVRSHARRVGKSFDC